MGLGWWELPLPEAETMHEQRTCSGRNVWAWKALVLLRVRMEARWEKTGLGPDPTARVPGRRSLLQVEEEGRGRGKHRPIQSRLWVLTWTPGCVNSVQTPCLQPSHPYFLATPNFTSSMILLHPPLSGPEEILKTNLYRHSLGAFSGVR